MVNSCASLVHKQQGNKAKLTDFFQGEIPSIPDHWEFKKLMRLLLQKLFFRYSLIGRKLIFHSYRFDSNNFLNLLIVFDNKKNIECQDGKQTKTELKSLAPSQIILSNVKFTAGGLVFHSASVQTQDLSSMIPNGSKQQITEWIWSAQDQDWTLTKKNSKNSN